MRAEELILLRHHAFPILSREKPHCCSHCCWCAGLMREMMLLLPELWQSCLLWDKVQLLENKQHVQSKLSAAMHSREDSSEPQTHRDSFTLRLQLEGNPVFCLKVMWFMAFGMCSKAPTCHMWPLQGCASIPAFYCADTAAFRWKEML